MEMIKRSVETFLHFEDEITSLEQGVIFENDNPNIRESFELWKGPQSPIGDAFFPRILSIIDLWKAVISVLQYRLTQVVSSSHLALFTLRSSISIQSIREVRSPRSDFEPGNASLRKEFEKDAFEYGSRGKPSLRLFVSSFIAHFSQFLPTLPACNCR